MTHTLSSAARRPPPDGYVAAIVACVSMSIGASAETTINTVREIRAALRACWIAPADVPRDKLQISVRLSFKQDGEVLGQPLITYESRDASEAERSALRAAVAEALARCSRLPLSDTLGGIIAGHPVNVRLGEGWRRGGSHFNKGGEAS
jgi:hypothetical protein